MAITNAASTRISITNPDGIAGNPTLDVVHANISINALGGTPLTTANGGTGVSSPTANTLPVAQGSSAMTFLGPLTNGAGSITTSSTALGLVWNYQCFHERRKRIFSK